MIILVNEIDYDAQVSRLTFVELEKCPGRLRKLIKDTMTTNTKCLDIQYYDSISFNDEYGENESWMAQTPCQVECVIKWFLS